FPATDSISTAIDQAPAAGSNGLDAMVNSSKAILYHFDKVVEVPGTETVLWITEGAKVDRLSVQTFLLRMQMDLNRRIAEHGPKAKPGPHTRAPCYEFGNRTSAGNKGRFFIAAETPGGLTYGMVNETLTGLRTFLLTQGRFEEVAFQVHGAENMRAIGLLTFFEQSAKSLLALGSEISRANRPTSLAGITDMDIQLQCTMGRPLHPAPVALLLNEALDEIKKNIRRDGTKGLLPGVAGEWEKDGQRGCVFRIDGIQPAHITWQITEVAVTLLKSLLVVEGRSSSEAKCEMMLGQDFIGVASLKENVLGKAEE
ncbi:MAG: hypothetical protein LQ341_006969, partial [Variospora aurantia]